MKYLNVSNARASFLRLVDHLDERIAIMRNGQPVAILLDFDDYRAICAAQALASDAERLAEIQAVARRVRAGDLDGFEAVYAMSTRWMNDILKDDEWTLLKEGVRAHWGKLTDDDLDQIQGRSEQFIGKLQERYGMARDEAERQVNALTRQARQGGLATNRHDD